jgi:hypothetical protein
MPKQEPDELEIWLGRGSAGKAGLADGVRARLGMPGGQAGQGSSSAADAAGERVCMHNLHNAEESLLEGRRLGQAASAPPHAPCWTS